ncbi:ClpXP protease specificity-enhancing factor [Citrobacter koseri]|uniref:ClpXP protease specificity-enhancing factor n=1 Tax=Citrobacter koseri TaxID=545 RepID=A0A2X2W8V9_CITKO|nr:ClpXP protease specificity-enhancing factor [Citrobacter koseri]
MSLWNMRATGKLFLNIAPRAVGNLELANDEVRFNARFGGVPRQVSVPLAAVLAIYARENGAGTMFEPEAAYDEDVASLNDDDVTPGAESETVMSVIDGDKPDHDDDNNPDDDPPPAAWWSTRITRSEVTKTDRP